MCGIFAYHGGDDEPDPGILTAAVTGAGRRGPHGCGWTVRTTLETKTRHHLSPLHKHAAGIVDACGPPRTVAVGHARLATVGAWDTTGNLQPITTGEYAVAHNGVIYNPDAFHPGAATDTIALAHAYRSLRTTGLDPLSCLDKLMAEADQMSWAVVVLDADGHLYAHRRRHPLYVLHHPGSHGVYASSHLFHPDALPLPEDHAVKLREDL